MDIVDPSRREVWQRFVREGILDQARMNKRIAESWYLCRQNNVNPFDGKGKIILAAPLLAERKKRNQRLLHIAMPILEKLQKYFQETKSILLLIDPEGYVLYAKGNQQVMEMAEAIKFVEGVKWTEDEVGTNAIGTSLRIREPITIAGLDHYSVASHQWCCSAAPIYDEKRELAGIIDVSYPVNHYPFHDHVLATVVATAYTIEQQFHMQAKEDELELLKHACNMKNPDSPVVICNNKGNIVWVSRCLRTSFSNMLDQSLENVCGDHWVIKSKTPIYSSVHHDMIGYRVMLQKAENHDFNFISATFHFTGVIGKSAAFANVIKSCEKVAKTDATVHITGETGTGKELIARAIHQNSRRKNRPFVAINCGAIPKELIGSELFGYEEGAFTGAKRTGHKGKFVQANGGTIFLDEIGEIPPEMQIALLRVLQEREVVPIGGIKPIPVDIRVITATHCDLYQLVREGKLREDLFYRIYVYPIKVPALRERKEDIPFLIQYYCQKNNWPVSFSNEVIQLFMTYHWPGNIRELFNVLERIRIEYGDHIPSIPELKSMFIGWENQGEHRKSEQKTLSYREQIEKNHMMEMLEKTKGDIARAAAELNIPRSTFYRKLKKYHLI
ncbi:sigma-54-dependent Fis family transcriptional regulator [Parageobacillus thermoglucosidasius]|uniref:Sigma-54-dependent Fis family transcriptional regulator n=1 Tax=Parageobacillus thermoglucosidasius TaxID=1426 RepID=A0AB38R4F1_PARTM|nr:sigma-54-dependent Fis family transcriptional regulator [Parageobacillus thermoglucosidasius]UOE77642.1 sigma-54-dependent Fis family transcriptional regulator [Parageobacillus thermoglucosidasius]